MCLYMQIHMKFPAFIRYFQTTTNTVLFSIGIEIFNASHRFYLTMMFTPV